jgi:hypothetical protein
MFELRTIVQAWIYLDGARVTDEYERFDGVNWRKKWEGGLPRPRAVIWLNEGTPADIVKAGVNLEHEHPEAPFRTVYVYSVDEPDPLNRAKEEALQAYRKGATRG